MPIKINVIFFTEKSADDLSDITQFYFRTLLALNDFQAGNQISG